VFAEEPLELTVNRRLTGGITTENEQISLVFETYPGQAQALVHERARSQPRQARTITFQAEDLWELREWLGKVLGAE